MFLNIAAGGVSSLERGKLSNIYQKFHNILGRGVDTTASEDKDVMQSARETGSVNDETFITPASSSGDLMAVSPRRVDLADVDPGSPDNIDDLLTGEHFDSICDVTMHEVTTLDTMYMDATGLDYLVKCAESNRNCNLMDMGKESLYVKFDPLYSRQNREEIILQQTNSNSSSNECDIGYETGSAGSVNTDNIVATPKRCASDDCMTSNVLNNKPTQRVLPAFKHDLTLPAIISGEPPATPALVRSMSAFMTPSRVAIDRLINIGTTPVDSPQHVHHNHFNTHQLDHLQSLRIILQKQDQEIMQLRQENKELRSTLSDTEHTLSDTEHKLSRTQEDLEAKIKKLTEEISNFADKENKFVQQINDKNMSNKQMSIVMEEYEKTISSLIAEQQKDNLQALELQEQLMRERDDALQHLAAMETAFNDLLSKYEKCKGVILELKDREKCLTEKISEYEVAVKKYDSLYSNLKDVTSESLAKANQTLDNLKKAHGHELAKLNASLKKYELTMSSLQESLTQKTRENEELTRICDQLINEVQ